MDQPIVLAVDDDPMMLEMISAALGNHFQVMTRMNVAEGLACIEAENPVAILLDVSMPDMNGYEACERIRQLENHADTPVLFVSGHDRLEDRMRGYEAGGTDYLVKPFDFAELELKVRRLVDLALEQRKLRDQSAFASSAAMTAMTEMGELGLVIGTMRQINACSDFPALCQALLAGMADFGLSGLVQVRVLNLTLTRNAKGEASPLEVSIISNMATMDRIVSYKSRLVINYPLFSLLVTNLPLDNPDQCGRLRDHLAILGESANTRAQAIHDAEESNRRGNLLVVQQRNAALGQAVAQITETLRTIDMVQRDSGVATQAAVTHLLEEVDNALLRVALSDDQERYLNAILRSGIEGIVSAQTSALDMQDQLSGIVRQLNSLTAAV